MAIKVNGTTVINDSRALQNVASVDAATKTAFGNAGFATESPPEPGPNWDPSATAQATFTSSGTWTKPGSIGDNDWVVFYLNGGGGGGSFDSTWGAGADGGGAVVAAALGKNIPSSITFTVGAAGSKGTSDGAAGTDGGDTSFTANSQTFTAEGGLGGNGAGGSPRPTPDGSYNVPFNGILGGSVTAGTPSNTSGGGGSSYGDPQNSVYGGGSGGGDFSSGRVGGTSVYAGNGGNSAKKGAPFNGVTPSGGGGGSNAGASTTGNGGAGQVRIFYGN